MNSDTCIILSHAPLEGELHQWDRLSRQDKIEMFEFAITMAKEMEPRSRVVLSGHGEYFASSADSIVWQMKYLEDEIGRGHPICVNAALGVAKAAGCKYVLKLRADSYIEDSRAIWYFKSLLKKDGTKCLVTAQTIADQQIGDLFMFGETDFLLDIWRPEKWDYSVNGMINLYRIYRSLYCNDMHDDFSYSEVKDLGWRLLSPDWLVHKGLGAGPEHNWDRYYGSKCTFDEYYKGYITPR